MTLYQPNTATELSMNTRTAAVTFSPTHEFVNTHTTVIDTDDTLPTWPAYEFFMSIHIVVVAVTDRQVYYI